MYQLEWDSKFWEIAIFNTDKEIDYMFNIPIINKPWIIQALVDEENLKTINKLENEGFRYVETKVNFSKKVVDKVEIDETHFKDVKHNEIEIYRYEFKNLYGEFSRFNKFNSEKISEFYYMWLINSINGDMDDKCIGYYIQGKLVGFITYKIKNDELIIGLIGVFLEFQSKGIGQKLLNKINNEAFNNDYKVVNVSTQGINYNAINLYIKNGYKLDNLQKWYYLRSDSCDIV